MATPAVALMMKTCQQTPLWNTRYVRPLHFVSTHLSASQQTITVNQGTLEHDAEVAATGMHDNRQNCFRFQFHHVLHNAGQDTIYDGLARDVVQGAVDGVSGERPNMNVRRFHGKYMSRMRTRPRLLQRQFQ